MMLHGEINPAGPLYNPIYIKDIEASGMDYLALGHVHTRMEPQKAGKTIYAYCGCPEGRGFDETGRKGVYIVSFEDKIKISFFPLDGAEYFDLTVDISHSSSPEKTILQALPYDTKNSLLRIALTGETEPDRLSLADIRKSVSELAFHVIIEDQTVPPVNIWEQCGDDSLRGIFLSLLKDRLNGTDNSEDRELIELAARYGFDALSGKESGYNDNP